MYVRWKIDHYRYGPRQAAQLVECKRVSGKPRQRVVMHLGTYSPLDGEDNLWKRVMFWGLLNARLEAADFPAETKETIIAEVAKRVPRPTEAEQGDVWRSRYWRGYGYGLVQREPQRLAAKRAAKGV